MLVSSKKIKHINFSQILIRVMISISLTSLKSNFIDFEVRLLFQHIDTRCCIHQNFVYWMKWLIKEN